ncbi:MAG: cryptochrome/photolyase family protein [Acidimicrobiales bacterium]
MQTVWVLGDQLNRSTGALRDADPAGTRVLFVRSEAKLASKRWHRQRLHLVLTAMRRFADELAAEGFAVDWREAPSLAAGLTAHRAAHRPDRVVAMAPLSWDGLHLLRRLDVEVVANDQMLCSAEEFALGGRSSPTPDGGLLPLAASTARLPHGRRRAGRGPLELRRRQPRAPTGRRPDVAGAGRRRPRRGGSGRAGVAPVVVRGGRAHRAVGHQPRRCPRPAAPVRRRGPAAVRPPRGRHAPGRLAPRPLAAVAVPQPRPAAPREVVEAAEAAHRAGRVPIASAEGFVRQVIGWREYVWGVFWLWMPEYRRENQLGATRSLPPAFTDPAATEMACVAHTVRGVQSRGWVHHIERLMVLGNLALLAGVAPGALVEWMWASFVDGAEWVMLPNVLGMALHADGGRMATKPYAAGGAYVDRMSDHCAGCRYDPRRRVGDDACPFTTLYWDFLARHEEALRGNHRMSRQLAALRRLRDLEDVRSRAAEVLVRLDAGTL